MIEEMIETSYSIYNKLKKNRLFALNKNKFKKKYVNVKKKILNFSPKKKPDYLFNAINYAINYIFRNKSFFSSVP